MGSARTPCGDAGYDEGRTEIDNYRFLNHADGLRELRTTSNHLILGGPHGVGIHVLRHATGSTEDRYVKSIYIHATSEVVLIGRGSRSPPSPPHLRPQ